MRRLVAGFFTVAFVVVSAAIAATDVTGTWSGTLQANDRCGGPGVPERTVQWSSAVTLELIQEQNAVSGNVSLNAPDFDANCQIRSTFPIVLPLNAQLAGDSLTGTVIVPSDRGPEANTFTGTVSGETMTITVTGDGFVGTATLTRTSRQRPGSALSGNYNGTYKLVEDHRQFCNNVGIVTSEGPIRISLQHTGSSVSGSVTLSNVTDVHEDPSKNCRVTPGDTFTAEFFGNVSGNTIMATILGDNEPIPIVVTVSGNTISGSVSDAGGSFSFSATRATTAPPAPSILSFTANPSNVAAGDSATLSWTTVNATGVTIDNSVGTQPSSGSVTVRPTGTTTYRLTASGPGGTVTAEVTVNVGGSPARVTVSSFPRGMVQATGQGGGTDSFTLTNVGGIPAVVTLSPSGNFYTIAPTSFTVPGGGTQTVAITGTAQPSGFNEGTVAVNPSGIIVIVRLLSATPPTADVQARATVSRTEVSGQAGQNPAGSVNFTNTGPVAIQTMAVSDQPWIVPQRDVITIQPGETKSVGFTIDSSKRPDAVGGATARFSLVFPSRPGASTKGALATTPTSSVSVSIVYVVVPGVGPGSPAPLAAGELALFVPGLANKAKAVGDLMIANRQSSGSLSDLKIYFPGSVANLPQILPNTAVTFPALIKNVFPGGPQSGTAQIRGSDLSKVAVGAVQLNTSSSAGTFGTALPVLRSDHGIGSGARMIISGVFKQPGVQTDLFVQELTGNPATVQIDFLGESGSVISSRAPDSIAAFGALEIPDAVPAAAMAVRITNNSTGAAKINAYGLVTSATSGDAWVVSDPAVNAAASDDTFTFPVLPAASDAQTVFYATNRTAAAASVSVDSRRTANRRHATPHSTTPLAVSSFNLAPYESLFAPSVSSSTAYIRITSAAGAMSVNARSVRPIEGAFGSGLPALPNSAAIGTGDLKRYAGVEDASPASRSAAAPGTFRTNLVLIETAGQAASVRVTLRYSFIAGALVSAGAVSSKEYAVTPSQFVSISDVIRDVIGNQRDSFGELHNMQLDVEVVSGSGRVLPYLQSIDNGSGDSIVRTE